MIDFKLKVGDVIDVQISADGKIETCQDTKCVMQKMFMYLNTNLGDFFYDKSQGVDWGEIYRYSQNEIAPFLINNISQIKGVQSVLNADISFDENRKMRTAIAVKDVFDKVIYIGG